MWHIFAFNGHKESGKDEAFKAIQNAFEPDYKVTRDAFADRLKLSAARLFYPDIDLEGAIKWADEFKNNGDVNMIQGIPSNNLIQVNGRQFLQRYGTEAHRDVFASDFWVSQVLPRAEGQELGDKEILVITDVRFPNEAQRVLDFGGNVIQIDRQEVAVGDTHASEQLLPMEYVTAVLDNNGTLDEFKRKTIDGVYHTIVAEDIEMDDDHDCGCI